MKLFSNHHVQYFLGSLVIAATIVVVLAVAASYIIEKLQP